ncbi:MAG: PEP-CTERM sorting domain-containing protein [Cyanobacteria bacterium J06636_16]
MSTSRKAFYSGLFVFSVALSGGWSSQAEAAQVNLLTNGGFETPEQVTKTLTFPTDTNNWTGDLSQITTAADGITPFKGDRMLQFSGSAGVGSSRIFINSDVFQLVDVTPFRDRVDSGTALLSATGLFNRVAGDTETDTLFKIALLAYSGSPETFPNQFSGSSALAKEEVELDSDADITTWEQMGTDLLLPSETDFVALRIVAGENVFNDARGIEFDGHYADAIELNINQVPEPITVLGTAAALGFV